MNTTVSSVANTTLNIAICDDNSAELSRVAAMLDEYIGQNPTETTAAAPALTYQLFQSGAELCSTMKAGLFDLLLLDVMMPGMNGMEVAREIRTFDIGAKIVFLTSSPEFAVESYEVKAADYILKPVKKERLFSVLDSITGDVPTPLEGLSVKTITGMVKIPYRQLAYLEVLQKKVYFHLTNGSVRETGGSLSDFEATLLSQSGFVKAHRSYIVNLSQMQELTGDELVAYSGESIPVSRLLYPQVRKAYMEHLFDEKEML